MAYALPCLQYYDFLIEWKSYFQKAVFPSILTGNIYFFCNYLSTKIFYLLWIKRNYSGKYLYCVRENTITIQFRCASGSTQPNASLKREPLLPTFHPLLQFDELSDLITPLLCQQLTNKFIMFLHIVFDSVNAF